MPFINTLHNKLFVKKVAKLLKYQRLSRACIVHLVIQKTNWYYVKTMSCSGSHLGITINIKNTKFVKDLPMIDAQFRFNQCNSTYCRVIFNNMPVLPDYSLKYFSFRVIMCNECYMFSHFILFFSLFCLTLYDRGKQTAKTAPLGSLVSFGNQFL